MSPRIIVAGLMAVLSSLSIAAFAAGTWVNGQAADVVLGQANFTTVNPTISSSIANHVSGVAVDPTSGKVFVVDTSSNRILRFASAAAMVSGSAAEAIFGQPNPTSSSPNAGGAPSAKTFSIPEGINVDVSGRMWVADRENHRVLRFDGVSTKASYSDADAVLGQANFALTTINRGGAVAANTLKQPLGVWHNGATLWVADAGNNRVLAYHFASSKPNGGAADVVLGQSLMTTSGPGPTLAQLNLPYAVTVAPNGSSLYVADAGNDRVLRFDDVDNKGNGAIANGRLGQSGQPSATTMDVPSGVAVDSAGRLYVADKNHNRVLVFNDAQNKPHGAAADNVLGHIDFGVALNGIVSEKTLYNPTSVFFDLSKNVLWVSEYYNNRAMRFSPFGALLDIDASGNPTKFDPFSDGLLILRYLFQLNGPTLTAGALGGTATRTDPVAVKAYLDSIKPALDVDNDGKQDALSDGLLILRYLFGLRGTALTDNAIGAGATRNSAATIEPYIQSLMQ